MVDGRSGKQEVRFKGAKTQWEARVVRVGRGTLVSAKRQE